MILERLAIRHFKRTWKLIYLRVGLRELRRRLGDLRQRGVVPTEGGLKGVYDLRRPLYEKHADAVVANWERTKALRWLLRISSRVWPSS